MMVKVRKEAGGLYRALYIYIMVNWSQGLVPNGDNEECSNRELKEHEPQQPTRGQVEGEHGEEMG